ncbi:MAG TPA: hypothetical protein VLX90_02750 [Steroidobacteraceae bacterium]|nr:hypothetical protein [Steroidobacteraceae bacterium]
MTARSGEDDPRPIAGQLKKLFLAYPFAVIGSCTGLVTGVLAFALNASGAVALVLLLLQPIFGMCIEILHRVQVLRMYSLFVDEDLKYLLSDSTAQRFVAAYLASSRNIREIDHPLLTMGTGTWRARAVRHLEEQSEGILSADLEPSQSLLREPELLSSVRNHLYATSLVNVAEYWEGTWGQNYLKYQGDLVRRLRRNWEPPKDASFSELSDSPVCRIFVQPRDRLAELRNVLVAHKAHRLYALVAVREQVPNNLRRDDFMIIDDTLVEKLELDDGRPAKAMFLVRGGKVDPLIDEAQKRFDELRAYAKPPEELPDIGLPWA